MSLSRVIQQKKKYIIPRRQKKATALVKDLKIAWVGSN
jgi:hypothetical protein